MARIALTGGAYTARSIIANAQRCVNLYPELSTQQDGSPTPSTHYPTPGLVVRIESPLNAPVRCVYRASNGDGYCVIGPNVYFISTDFSLLKVGTIAALTTPCYFSDNGLVLVLVDGTANGYAIDMVERTFGLITSPDFYGSTRADYIDTFFIFNKPGTFIWYSSLSNVTFSVLTGVPGSITSGSLAGVGSGYTDGFYQSVALYGGTGQGAIADITVVGGSVQLAHVVDTGIGFTLGDVLYPTPSALNPTGPVGSSVVDESGSGYTPGTYTAVFTGGTGSGFTATIVIGAGRSVTSATPLTQGIGYTVGDLLSTSSIPAGSGIQVEVASIVYGTGFAYQVQTIAGGGFDPLYYSAKEGSPDPIQSLIVMHREIWLIGQLTSEVWYNAGNTDFPFGILTGAFIEHGTVAPYSLAAQDLTVFFLSQDRQGRCVVYEGASYIVQRVSTHAIENEIQTYPSTSDAIGYTYQQEGHVFYVLTFPSADKTWVFDVSTRLWHERAWYDGSGNPHRHRGMSCANIYGRTLVGDWQNGLIYSYELDTYTDNSDPIPRIRSFPHQVNELKKVAYSQFIADMEVGTSNPPFLQLPNPEALTYQDPSANSDQFQNSGFDTLTFTSTNEVTNPIWVNNAYTTVAWKNTGSAIVIWANNAPVPTDVISAPPTVSLRWSDDRGYSWSNAIEQSLGLTGESLTNVQWRRLGIARDRVFELSWSIPAKTALNGAFVQFVSSRT